MAKLAGMTPQQIAQKLANNAAAAAPQYQASIKAVVDNPCAKAAAAKSSWLTNVTASADYWAARVGAVTLQQWQNACIQKGAQRLGQGIQAAAQKIVQFWTQWFPILQDGMNQVRNMPKATFADRMNRMQFMANFLHQNGQRRRP